MHNYELTIREAPLIDHHRYDEARAEILRLHNERFEGNPSIQDTRTYRNGEPLIGSNTPRALSYHHYARKLGILETPVLSFEDVVRYYPFIFEKDSTLADTRDVAVFSNKHENPDNEKLRQQTFNGLGITGTDTPLIVSGLYPLPDVDNSTYGFGLIADEGLTSYPAPFLQHDCKVRWDGEKIVKCKEGEEGIPIYVSNFQSGSRRLCRYGSEGLDVRFDYLLSSSVAGRVQFIYEPKARAQNLEARI